MFFLLFCSSPVKKYIRMQLYKKSPLMESVAGDHFSKHDIKDCLIAERTDHGKITVPDLLLFSGDPLSYGFFFIPLYFSIGLLIPFRKRTDTSPIPIRIFALPSVPIYLRHRHLSV